MPVSKNKRKDKTTAAQRARAKRARMQKANRGVTTIGKALQQFNVIRENIRILARYYVDLTKAIPGYTETDPTVLVGLREAIPMLKMINSRYDEIAKASAELASNPKADEFEWMPIATAFEEMYMNFAENFIPAFLPVINAVERLGSSKDKTLAANTKAMLEHANPTFETKVD